MRSERGQQCAGRGLASYQRCAQEARHAEQQARRVRGKRRRVEVVELGSQRGGDRSSLVTDDAGERSNPKRGLLGGCPADGMFKGRS